MNYKLRHQTTYTYSKPVTFARCAMRLTPRQGDDQTVISSHLTITPMPSRLEERTGPFGERVVDAIIDTPHKELKVEALSEVAVHRASLLPGFTGPSWDSVRDDASASASLEVNSPANFLYPTDMTRLDPAMTAYVAECFAPGRSMVEAAHALSCRIKAEFAYDSDATQVSTPAIEAFAARRGVCQDFAHIMISGLKGLGLPAAYVSGYLRTTPPPGKPRLQGADATHAWVDLWCGKGLGWVGFDPTNALIVAGDHIVLAVGRDYADVAPMGGVVLGPGDQTIDVAVDVVPDDETRTLEDAAWAWARKRG